MAETKTPRIVTWCSDDAPMGFRWLARFWIVSGDPQKPRMEFHPVVICAETEQSAIGKANMWWANEVAKAERKKTGLEKARLTRLALAEGKQ